MTKVRNQYSAEFKLELIKLIEEQGQKVPDVAGQYNVGKSTLEKWLQRYRAEQSGKPLITGSDPCCQIRSKTLGRIHQAA